MSKLIDLSGNRYGKIVAIERDGSHGKSATWRCRCDCGKEFIIDGSYLRDNVSRSCGCDTYEDITGKRFGMLIVIREEKSEEGKTLGFLCKCDCGNEKIINRTRLTKGENKSCGCLKHKKTDYSGQKFGMLTVIKRTRTDDNRNVYYECLCDCGNIKEIPSRYFVYGSTQSCGCLYRKSVENSIEDLTGQKFNRLTVIEFIRTESSNGNMRNYWKCLCDCGNYKKAESRTLKNGSVKSCGCLRKEMHLLAHKKENNQAAKNSIYATYVKGAKNRGIEFGLTKERVVELIEKDCFYCGKPPSNIKKLQSTTEDYSYNGIDRVDNQKGYVEGNVVSCCIQCNASKKDLPLEEFYKWIINVYDKLKENKN